MEHSPVPNKHIKTLNRRLRYLEKLQAAGEANSYDLAEIAALRAGLEVISPRSLEEKEGPQHGG